MFPFLMHRLHLSNQNLFDPQEEDMFSGRKVLGGDALMYGKPDYNIKDSDLNIF